MSVEERITRHGDELTAAERRVAEVVLGRPQEIAFGTVAGLARLTGTSGATVVRFATKLGFDGYIGLQESVQAELSARLGPAAERIRRPPEGDDLARALTVETDNVEATLRGVQSRTFGQAVALLSDPERHVYFCPGDCARGVASLTVDQLFSLRPGVTLIEGNQLQVGRQLARTEPGDVLVAIDFHRYDRWVLLAAGLSRQRQAKVVALTDSRIGPLARTADLTFPVSVAGAGPFDSQVATLALLNALVAAVAGKRRETAAKHLEAVEDLWQTMGALTDGE
ncbi:MurR/RpiR family transcriptional regulator [Actinomadura sp. B10D3]|uniref:MurR/RpiR family transcriptional regulator n=1 Tax=Actinomadura sp. B10D3 TaxID=3153557 RepID=UPI00325DE207